MNRRIRVRRALANSLRLIIPVILVVVAGGTFNADAQIETSLYSFGRFPDGQNPWGGLVQGSDGNFYGTTVSAGRTVPVRHRVSDQSRRQLHESLLLWQLPQRWELNPKPGWCRAATAISTGRPYVRRNERRRHRVSDQSQRQLHESLLLWQAPPTMGRIQMPGWCRAATAISTGRPGNGGTDGRGTVFRISPSGSYTNLYSFGSLPQRWGESMQPRWCRAATAISTGRPSTAGRQGNGTVFRISPSGSYTNLYSFGSFPNDGSQSTSRAGAGQRRQFLRDDRLRRDEQQRHRVSDQSQRQLHESLLLSATPQAMGPIPGSGWCRAVTEISTGRP